MAELNQLAQPIYWGMTPIIHKVAMESMDNRARDELSIVLEGLDISEAHGEVVSHYNFHRKLIGGAARFAANIGFPVRGAGADLGSGTGGGACIVSHYPTVEKVYAVECSELFVTGIMPVVFERFNGKVEKIQRVVGDFNHIDLPDESLDFLVEIASYHHSEDLSLTARESWRVLKPGGVIIAIERAWPDTTSPEELQKKLDRPLNQALKKKYGLPEDQPFTRRDWGEHEYTVRQWEAEFQAQGFTTIALIQGHPKIRGSNFILTKIPAYELSLLLAKRRYKGGSCRLPVYGWQVQEVVFIFIKK